MFDPTQNCQITFYLLSIYISVRKVTLLNPVGLDIHHSVPPPPPFCWGGGGGVNLYQIFEKGGT